MSVANRFALQQVFDVLLIDPVTDQIKCRLVDCKKTGFKQESEIKYATGGKSNVKIVGFDTSKTAVFDVSSAMILADLFGAQTGSAPVVGSNTDFVLTDILTVTSNVATCTATPLGTTNAEIAYAYIIADDGSISTEFKQDAIVGAGKFTLTGKLLTFNTGEVPDDTRILLKYNATTASDTVTYSSYADIFSDNVKVVADSVVKACDGEVYNAQLLIYNGKMNNNFTLDVSADGDPVIYDFSVEALKNCISTKLWDIIIYNESTIV